MISNSFKSLNNLIKTSYLSRYKHYSSSLKFEDSIGFIDKDTIFSLSSGSGKSGVAVIRVSGDETKNVLKSLTNDKFSQLKNNIKPRYATLSTFFDPISKEPIDKGIFIYFQSPNTFTGEDIVEFHIHGGRAVIHDTLEAISKVPGTRTSKPGEFTKRALYNNKMDLTAVEGLADLLDAQTHHQRRVALDQIEGSVKKFYDGLRTDLIKSSAYMTAFIDFGEDAELDPEIVEDSKRRVIAIKDRILKHLEDGRRGERLRDGAYITILGAPNAGKSTLINYLAKRKVSIVSPIPGTTRDVIEALLDIGGYPVILGDTAGIRDSTDQIEQEGVEMAKQRFENADQNLVLFDSLEILNSNLVQIDKKLLKFINLKSIIVFTKMDLISNEDKHLWNKKKKEFLAILNNNNGNEEIRNFEISYQNDSIHLLLNEIQNNLNLLFKHENSDEAPLLTRLRYKESLTNCVESLDRFLSYHDSDVVLASEELKSAITSLGEVTHSTHVDDLLDIIFREFCIGK